MWLRYDVNITEFIHWRVHSFGSFVKKNNNFEKTSIRFKCQNIMSSFAEGVSSYCSACIGEINSESSQPPSKVTPSQHQKFFSSGFSFPFAFKRCFASEETRPPTPTPTHTHLILMTLVFHLRFYENRRTPSKKNEKKSSGPFINSVRSDIHFSTENRHLTRHALFRAISQSILYSRLSVSVYPSSLSLSRVTQMNINTISERMFLYIKGAPLKKRAY